MTLVIALIANSIHLKLTGTEYLSSVTIALLWAVHVAYHSTSKKD